MEPPWDKESVRLQTTSLSVATFVAWLEANLLPWQLPLVSLVCDVLDQNLGSKLTKVVLSAALKLTLVNGRHRLLVVNDQRHRDSLPIREIARHDKSTWIYRNRQPSSLKQKHATNAQRETDILWPGVETLLELDVGDFPVQCCPQVE